MATLIDLVSGESYLVEEDLDEVAKALRGGGAAPLNLAKVESTSGRIYVYEHGVAGLRDAAAVEPSSPVPRLP